MFNSPRGNQRYVGSSANGFGSYVDEGPLGGSAYDGLDPWSTAPTPSPPPAPSRPSIFTSVIADAAVPAIYNKAYATVDPTNTGETSVNALSHILRTSSLPDATIDKIVNLVSSKPRVSRLEFFVALALVALAQAGKDVSIEQVAALSTQNTLPEPSLNLDILPPSTSALLFTPPISDKPTNIPIRAPAPAYASDDPWNTSRFPTGNSGFDPSRGLLGTGPPSALAGTGLPIGWWMRQETARVSILGQQGFILNRYTVYELSTDKGAPVPRRYSEFVYLWECLVRRYPFRLFPALPPKRIGPDEQFIEQRRRGLARFINFVINHPIIKDDGLLSVFLTEPSFESWRKHTTVSLEEESTSKRVSSAEEMSIPSDLDDKLLTVRRKITPLIEQWQRICILADRIIKRREAAAVRILPALPRTYLQTHPAFSPLFPSLSTDSQPDSHSISTLPSFLSFLTTDFYWDIFNNQADMSRLTNVMKALVEINDRCWRGDACDLCDGVRQGIGCLALHTQRYSDLTEQRTTALLHTTLEALKSQRDLYIAMRDLFIRHDRLSIDQVERLKKRVEANGLKLEGIKAAQKEGYQDEIERFNVLIEKDRATIAAQMHRRVFTRACMWHELRVVLHNRENALVSQAIQAFAREEHDVSEHTSANWASLITGVENMPFD